MSAGEDPVASLEALLARLEDARARLDAVEDADGALPILAELHELSQAVAAEVDRRRRAAADEAEQDDGQLELG